MLGKTLLSRRADGHLDQLESHRLRVEGVGGLEVAGRPAALPELWKRRHKSIREHEEHLARSGTVVLKFFLNVSREEQRGRFLARLDEPDKNWKFSAGDVAERAHWDAYMAAYEDALNATSRAHAPWYAIPADSKSYMRMCVADIVVRTLERLDLRYPTVDAATQARFAEMRARLAADES
jgi:polyphosphate kinase 2 (PPK2 family)